MKIVCVAGARPNFVKIAPILAAFEARKSSGQDFSVSFVHTGQHYDETMSGSFLADLGIPEPDENLGVGSGSHAEQTARVMVAFERFLSTNGADLVVVVGDVNSTLGCALVAAKMLIPVAHIEAGLRSFDRSMPEEVNRVLTDAISDLCFTTCREGDNNLAREGVLNSKVFFVGNVMIDTLLKNRARAQRPGFFDPLRLTETGYALITMHRPANVDRKDEATRVLQVIESVEAHLPVVFPVHPRTSSTFERHGLAAKLTAMRGLHMVEPLPYLQFLYALEHARVVLTDSGGIQEETTVLDVPCLTLRENTERGVTIEEGTNRLVGLSPTAVEAAVLEVLGGAWPRGRRPELWDGGAATRIVDVILGQWWASRPVPNRRASVS